LNRPSSCRGLDVDELLVVDGDAGALLDPGRGLHQGQRIVADVREGDVQAVSGGDR